MSLSVETKKELFAKFGGNEKNTGSTESQVALFTARINHLTEHLKANKHDFGTKKSLLALVGKRKGLLDYLKKQDILRYRALIKELSLRK